ncbi:MAG: hypothetical protein ACRDMV_03905 [Streptosporangiales bacterium]
MTELEWRRQAIEQCVERIRGYGWLTDTVDEQILDREIHLTVHRLINGELAAAVDGDKHEPKATS